MDVAFYFYKNRYFNPQLVINFHKFQNQNHKFQTQAQEKKHEPTHKSGFFQHKQIEFLHEKFELGERGTQANRIPS